jgi:phage shock protein A
MTKLTELFGRRVGDSVHPAGAKEGAFAPWLARATDELVQAKNDVALAKKEERRLAKQVDAMARAAEHWGQHAMSAMRAGDDVVAKDALVRKRDYERTADELRRAEAKQRQEVERLIAALSQENLRVEQIKHRTNGLVLRAKLVHAEQLLGSLAREARGDASLELLDRLDALLLDVEREMALRRELSEQRTSAPSPGAALEALRVESEFRVLKELAKAKRKGAKKPLAKTRRAGEGENSRTGAAVSRLRRTKR